MNKEADKAYNKSVRDSRRRAKTGLVFSQGSEGSEGSGYKATTQHLEYHFAAATSSFSGNVTNLGLGCDEMEAPDAPPNKVPALEPEPEPEPSLPEPVVPIEMGSINPETVVIDATTAYRLSLNKDGGVILINRKMIGIAEYNPAKRNINVTDYRVIVCVQGALLCSCQRTQELLMGECRAEVCGSSERCIHLDVLRSSNIPTIAEWFDEEHNYNCQNPVEEAMVCPVNDWTAVVFEEKTKRFGCVFVHAGNVRCRCTSHRGCCSFIRAFRNALYRDENMQVLKENLESPQVTTVTERTCVSWKAIPIAVPRLETPTASSMMKLECKECASRQFDRVTQKDIVCYSAASSFNIRATVGLCVACGVVRQCDGGEMGILNMGDYAVSHQVLRDYLKLFVSDGLPLRSYYKKLYWTYLEQGEVTGNIISHHFLRMAWTSFCGLLTLGNFSCPLCCSAPPVIICDGLVMSFRKRHRLMPPAACQSARKEQLSGCSHAQVVMVNDKLYRKRLSTTLSAPDIQEEDVLSLIEGAKAHAPFLVPALESFVGAQHVPARWKALLKDVSKSSPASGLAQCRSSELEELWGSLQSRLTSHRLNDLRDLCPPLFEFMKRAGDDDWLLLEPIVAEILVRLRYVEDQPQHALKDAAVQQELDRTGSFPDQPKIRERGHYSMDSKNDTSSCRRHTKKSTKGHKTLLPGIFLIHCEHGVCYGFHVMDNHESPDIPFTVMLTRFPQAPKVIFYDNACHLHEYVLNRNPAFFCRTKFLVDRFHWFNHTGCSSGYCVDGYPELSTLNTQVAEQRNATLNRLKASLSYQNQDNFFMSMRVFLSFRNTLKVLKLREPENDAEHVMRQLSVLYR